MRHPYYKDPKRDPDLENYPSGQSPHRNASDVKEKRIPQALEVTSPALFSVGFRVSIYGLCLGFIGFGVRCRVQVLS